MVGISISSCKSDSNSQTTEKKMISKITNTGVKLKDGSIIPFPTDAKVSTFFVVRPGQYSLDGNRQMAALTTTGHLYAQSLVKLFEGAGINSVLGIGSRYASETATPLAEANNTEVLTYNNSDYGAFLDYVFNTQRGDKFVVFETHGRIPELLRTLTPGTIFPTYPKGVFNKIYMVTASERTKATVHELHF